MHFRSSFIHILCHFLLVLAIGMLPAVALERHIAVPAATVLVYALLAVACAGYVLGRGFVGVDIDGKEIRVKYLFSSARVFPLENHFFHPQIAVFTVYYLPVWTSRTLTVKPSGGKAVEFNMPNMTRRTYNAMNAELRRHKAVAAAAGPVEMVEYGFVIDRQRMLREYHRILMILAGIGVAAIGGLYWLVHEMSATGTVAWTPLIIASVVLCLLYSPFFHSYLQRRLFARESIEIRREGVTVDGEQMPWPAIAAITATPPDHKETPREHDRWIVIDSEWGRKKMYMGLRSPRGFLATGVQEYPELCMVLERAAIANNVPFVYDL